MAKWISVEEELPTEEIAVAACVDDSARKKWLLFLRGGKWYVIGYKAQRFYCNITHWMKGDDFWEYLELEHIPDPPQKVNDRED